MAEYTHSNCYMLHVTFYFLNTDKLRDLSCFWMVAYGVEGEGREMILIIIISSIYYIYIIYIIIYII